ncbi:GrpB family protein [Bacillus sp. SG-1]|uniref:GrpB family protein n=1 Tax=Bacillus sp. SG-1 TaxID=161544 RepID=UPI0001545009|nr:GrpB family protein [Bacillus sp. SG-1]EDL64533.1 hypothetical protein BSG1_08341 [Bacillus sp. SG-1]
MAHSGIVIWEYNANWGVEFESIKGVIKNRLGDSIIAIEHVGSTAVPGLGAKPILDIDIVIEGYEIFPKVVFALERLGYFHQKEWSFEGREAFGRKDESVPWTREGSSWMQHHLYVCDEQSSELAKHIAFRNYLRGNPQAAYEYEKLKRNLAKIESQRPSYTSGKTEFIQSILGKIMEKEGD